MPGWSEPSTWGVICPSSGAGSVACGSPVTVSGGRRRTGRRRWPCCVARSIPLYQFHRPDPKVPLEDSVGALVTLKEQGKIRHIGLSNATEDQLRRAQRLTPIVSIQNRYNVDDRRSESLVDLCEQEQLVFLPWAPIQDLDRDRTVQDIARRHDATPRQLVLAWRTTSPRRRSG